jgi:hypothetical protein
MLRGMANTGLSLTIPAKGGTRTQLDREKKELLDLIREAEGVPHDYHPLIELAKLACSTRLPMNLKMRAHSELALYITPKLKVVEPKNGEAKEVPVLEFISAIESPEEYERITGRELPET